MPARIAVGLSDSLDTEEACAAAARDAGDGLGAAPDLCFVFAAAPHLAELQSGIELISGELEPGAMLGCGAGGVVGPGREIEAGPGVVVWAAELPGSTLRSFEVTAEGEPGGWDLTGVPDPVQRAGAVLLLSDPFGFPTDVLLARLNDERPGIPVLGGLASATVRGGGGVLIRDRELTSGSAVGCLLDGVDLTPCVSQGATPVGPEMTVTAAEGNVIAELASKPALTRLGEVIASLDPEQRQQASDGLLVGIVIDENQPDHERGDFLVRPIIGADRGSGALAIGEPVRVGQTIRLQVRDGDSADADLREALSLQAGAMGEAGSAGALLFTCNGRGRGMFGVADHDADAVDDALDAPVGGFFCAGEMGPVGGRNFLHGFTATLAVFAAE